MVTDLYTQDLDSHDHIPLVRPTWESVCRGMGESITTLRADVLEAYEQAVDQFAYYESLRIEAVTPAESPRLAA